MFVCISRRPEPVTKESGTLTLTECEVKLVNQHKSLAHSANSPSFFTYSNHFRQSAEKYQVKPGGASPGVLPSIFNATPGLTARGSPTANRHPTLESRATTTGLPTLPLHELHGRRPLRDSRSTTPIELPASVPFPPAIRPELLVESGLRLPGES